VSATIVGRNRILSKQHHVNRCFSPFPLFFSGCGYTASFIWRIEDSWETGVWRGCATAVRVDCTTVTNKPVPELHLNDATVELCYCVGHLCNAAGRHVFVADPVAGGFIVVGLLALTGARFISG